MEPAVIIINWTTFIWFLFTSSHFSHPNKCISSKSINSKVNQGVLRNAVIILLPRKNFSKPRNFCCCWLLCVFLAFQDHRSKYKRDIESFCNSTTLSFSVTEIFSLADRDQGSEHSQRSVFCKVTHDLWKRNQLKRWRRQIFLLWIKIIALKCCYVQKQPKYCKGKRSTKYETVTRKIIEFLASTHVLMKSMESCKTPSLMPKDAKIQQKKKTEWEEDQ